MNKESLLQKFGLLIASSIITIVLSAASASYLANRAARATIIDNAAPMDYVDRKIIDVTIHSDNEDKKLQDQIDKKANSTRLEKLEKTLEIMDSRIYDLWKERK
jgi:hypothetical protein